MKSKAFFIDTIITCIYVLPLFFLCRYMFIVKHNSLFALLFVIHVPLVWTYLIFSLLGKKTIGNRIINKQKQK